MSLALRGVRAGYGQSDVLHDVDLCVPAGHVVALLGPNGAGKTTLLQTLSGLLRPTRGGIELDGDDISGLAPARIAERGVCHVTEQRAIFPTLTVREHLRLFARPGDAVDRAVDAFPALGSRLDQRAGTMSGGEQQMLALARAYLKDPGYVLLDEASMGLAPRIVDEIFEALSVLSSTGCGLLVVEQFVDRALAIADIVYVLRRGQVRFVGESRELDAARLAQEYLGVSTPTDPGRELCPTT